jgi:hypothetical protein
MKHNDIIKILSRFAEVKDVSLHLLNWYQVENTYKILSWNSIDDIVTIILIYLKDVTSSNYKTDYFCLNDDKLVIKAIDDFLTIETNKKINNLNFIIEIKSENLKRTANLILQDLNNLFNLGNYRIIQMFDVNIGMIDNFLNNKIDSGIFLDYVKENYSEIEYFINEAR